MSTTTFIDGASFGERLKQARGLRGYSQKQVGLHVGYSREQVGLWERGSGTPPVEILIEIARFLRVPVAAFVEGLDGNNPDPDGGSRNPNVTLEKLKVIAGIGPKRLVPITQPAFTDAA